MAQARSIRRVMVASLIAVISVTSAATAFVSYREARIEAGELFDAKLAHSARVLRALADQQLRDDAESGRAAPRIVEVWQGEASGEGEDLATESGHVYETKLAFQVWRDDGSLLLRSANAPDTPLAPLRRGFARAPEAAEGWRTFTLRAPGGRWYQAGEGDGIRAELARDVAFGSLLPLLVELPLLALLVWLIVDWGCRPLQRIASDVEARAIDRLEPLAPEGAPLEVAGLVHAINRLLHRLEDALGRERRFTADAAHELRTPISALKVQVENVHAAADPGERRSALDRLDRGVARLERVVEQLLAMARVEPGASLPGPAPVRLQACVAQELADLAPRAAARGIELDFDDASADAAVPGDEFALGVMVRNLVDNAVRYTPGGGRVSVRLARSGAGLRLEVEDSGPGIAPERRERVFDRFYRELGTDAEGSGLGLSIVKRVVDLHGGSVVLDRSGRLGGLRATVELPVAS